MLKVDGPRLLLSTASRTVSLLVCSRLEYGGRNSSCVSLLPLLCLSALALIGYSSGVHGSCWEAFLIVGISLSLLVLGYAAASLAEYASMGTVIASASGLECLAWLVLFEVCFFGGVSWSLGVASVHATAEVGLRAMDVFGGSSDALGLRLSDSGVCSAWSPSLNMAEASLPSLLSLVILLLVTLLLQLVHRSSLVVRLSLEPWC